MLSVDIRKRLGSFQLDVSFEAESEVIALLGASGCGKSMTLKCIAGIVKPDDGRIVLNGRVLFDSAKRINLPPQERRVGYLFQQFSLFPNMTVEKNIASAVLGRDKAERREIVDRQLDAFRLRGQEHKRPGQISGGQQQRAALARMLAGEPETILLDEPFSALDEYLKWQIELELADVLTRFGGPAIYVSHNRDEVYRLCSSVCVLDEGKSAPKQTVGGLFTAPTTVSACMLSGCKNISRAEPRDGGLYAVDWGVQLQTDRPSDGTMHIGVRAHYVSPCTADAENAIPCTVSRVVDNMFSTIVMLNTPGGSYGPSLIRMEIPKEEYKRLCLDGTVYVKINPADIMLLKGD